MNTKLACNDMHAQVGQHKKSRKKKNTNLTFLQFSALGTATCSLQKIKLVKYYNLSCPNQATFLWISIG